MNPVPCREMPRNHGGPAGGAYTAGDMELGVLCALGSKMVKVWSGHLCMTVASQVPISPVIGKDEEDIGLIICRFFVELAGRGQKNQAYTE